MSSKEAKDKEIQALRNSIVTKRLMIQSLVDRNDKLTDECAKALNMIEFLQKFIEKHGLDVGHNL